MIEIPKECFQLPVMLNAHEQNMTALLDLGVIRGSHHSQSTVPHHHTVNHIQKFAKGHGPIKAHPQRAGLGLEGVCRPLHEVGGIIQKQGFDLIFFELTIVDLLEALYLYLLLIVFPLIDMIQILLLRDLPAAS